MIIFLYGPDTYRSRQKLNEIVGHYQKIHRGGLNLIYLDGKNLNFQDFKSQFQQTSMFKGKKLVILINTFSNPDFVKSFLENGRFFLDSENIILFYEKSQIPEKDPLFLFLKKYAKSQEFNLLAEKELRYWVKKEIEKFEGEIEQNALNKLVDFVGNNLWQMENEIQKLVSYKNREVILVKDVELLVRPKIEPDIFETIDAIASKDKKRAIQLLKTHLEKGDSLFYLFSMIIFQFRNLLMIKDLIERNLSPYNLTNLHPYVIKKSYLLSKRFEISELKKIYQKIFEVDLAIKTGKIEPETALDMLIAEI